MTEQEFHEIILIKLGVNLVDVELTEDDLDRCFARAKLVKKTKGNINTKEGFFELPGNDYIRPLPSTIEITSIIEIIGGTYSLFMDSMGPGMAFDVYNGFLPTANYFCGDRVIYTLQTRLVEDMRKRYGTVPYIHNKHDNTIRIMKKTSDLIVRAYYMPTDDELRDDLWIQEWAYSEALYILGRAYSKFSSLPGPSGETSMNGDQMIQEAQEIQEQLLEDIRNHVDTDNTTFSPIIFG